MEIVRTRFPGAKARDAALRMTTMNGWRVA
jgi:hypothetical protein